jgi:pseudaminic acid synthase
MRIGHCAIGRDQPVFIIAEMSANHHQRFDEAVRIIHAIKETGADAVKLQTYSADAHTIDCDAPHFTISGGTGWDGKTLHSLYREAYMPWNWQPKLAAVAAEVGLILFSAPVDAASLAFLEGMNVPAHKISSFEIVDLPLIRRVAATGKPVIMSTGMASLAEIEEAVGAFRASGGGELALLKCTSAYPATPSEMNLRTIPHLAATFDVPVGLSDHSLGIAVPVAAVALGANIIEKHFTLSRDHPGPDNAFSLEPSEFAAMVRAVRAAEQALGTVRYELTQSEEASRAFRRSLFVVKDTETGDILSEESVRSIRPGNGLPPKFLDQVIGRKASRPLKKGTPLSWDCLE